MRRRAGLAGKLNRALGVLETNSALDGPGYALETALARPGQLLGRPVERVGNTLHGTWWGHPLHPALVTIPIGTWTLAFALDVLAGFGSQRGKAAETAAGMALKAGAVGAVAAAAAGMADWQHTNGRDRRVGLVHALVNSTALTLNLLSIRVRRHGRLGQGRALSIAGWACMLVGGYLGGHLVYRRRTGVDQADRSKEPREFQPVAQLADLEDNRPHRVEVWDEDERRAIGVVLVRQGARVHAMGARCSHRGGPLDQGWVLAGALVCPWHGSRYDLATGWPSSGPSTCPQPRYEVRLRGGAVEIRREQEPGDDVVRAADLPPQPVPETAEGKKADEVLTEHHMLIRRMFETIETIPREDPARRDLLRTLATELEIHEHIEDKIFYPAVQRVTEDIPIAHSEHRQLADLLAATLKLNTATNAFGEHLRALHTAVEHHAGSEERSMFPDAQRLGDARLRELGRQLEDMMEEERASILRRTFLSLKVRLLEGI